jgi:rhamnosyl/mannosyltransferase
LKILEVATDAPPYKGGISRLVGLLSHGLRSRGHIVKVLTPRFRFKELKLSSIPFRKYKEYDIIHLHGPTPFLSDLMFITNGELPIVYTHHAEISYLSDKLSSIYRNFHRILSKKARVIIVHSYDYARLFNKGNVIVVRMPCLFKPSNSFNLKEKENAENFTVLYVGQLRPFKGVDLLIKAASLIRNVNFVIAGEGYLKTKLMNMAKELKNVKFTGAISDDELKNLYKKAHVICLPSINTTEAYGLVLIEGALYGCVPLAPNLIGVRENISQLRGLLFETNSLASLVKKIRVLANNRRLWINLAERSQKAAVSYVNIYTPDYYVNKHEEVFRECLLHV